MDVQYSRWNLHEDESYGVHWPSDSVWLPILPSMTIYSRWVSLSRWPLSIPFPLQVRFTDIDYSVYHDAAMAVVEGGSPYDRWEGKRIEGEGDSLIQGNISILSSPRLATHPQCRFRCLRYVNNQNLYCVPHTILCMQQISGKLLFCSADILVGWLCLRLGDEMRKRRGEAKDEWVKKVFWLLEIPIVFWCAILNGKLTDISKFYDFFAEKIQFSVIQLSSG